MSDTIRVNTDDLAYIAKRLIRLSGEIDDINTQLYMLRARLPQRAQELVIMDLLHEYRQLIDAAERIKQLAHRVKDGADSIEQCEHMLRTVFSDELRLSSSEFADDRMHRKKG